MVALYNTATKIVVENYGNTVPDMIVVDGLIIQCPKEDWSHGDYKFIPVVYHGERFDDFQIITEKNQTLTIAANGHTELVITTIYADPPLSDVKIDLCGRLDAMAKTIRTQYVNDDATQVGVYVFKYLEAREIQSDPEPDANNYPIHKPLVNTAVANTIQEAADATVNQFNQWITIGADIDKTRLTGRARIMSANTVTDAIEAFYAVQWDKKYGVFNERVGERRPRLIDKYV